MKNLIIVYDDWCPYCIRFSKLIKKFDILRKISFFKLRKDSIDIENFDNNLALKKWLLIKMVYGCMVLNPFIEYSKKFLYSGFSFHYFTF